MIKWKQLVVIALVCADLLTKAVEVKDCLPHVLQMSAVNNKEILLAFLVRNFLHSYGSYVILVNTCS